MKKIALLCIVMMVMPCLLTAQEATGKGSRLIGGSASFTHTTGKYYENENGDGRTHLIINPSALYFVSPGLGLGGSLLYDRFSQGDSNTTQLGIGPKAAYFMGSGGTSLIPFGTVSFLYNSGKTSSEIKITNTILMFELGIMKMVAKNVGLSAAAFFQTLSFKQENFDAVKGTVLGINFGINTFLLK